MPQYHIFSRGRGTKGPYSSEGIISGDGPRNAWGRFKAYLKKENKTADPLKEYQFYPINHARTWQYKKDKWAINSFYGNHDGKKYRAAMTNRMRAAHQNKIQVKHDTSTS